MSINFYYGGGVTLFVLTVLSGILRLTDTVPGSPTYGLTYSVYPMAVIGILWVIFISWYIYKEVVK